MKRSVSLWSLSVAAGLLFLTVHSASAGGADEIRAAAEQRQARLLELARSDPAEVLRLAVTPEERLSMPSPIRGFVEERVEVEGTLEVLVEDFAGGSRTHHFLDADGQRFELVFTSAAPRMLSGDSARVSGVRVDHTIVIEPSAANFRAGASTKGMQSVNALPNTFGAQRTAVILVNFSNNPTQPYTVATARSVVFTQTSNWDLENSYGQTWLTGDVFGWFTIPVSSSVCDYTSIDSYGQQAATAAGVNLANYTHYVYAFPQNACSWWGLGSVGGTPYTRAWINGSLQLQVVAHEMGHNFGLYHAHSLDCGADVLASTGCTMSEYGDTLDTMGSTAAYHFNSFEKERLGWLAYGSSPALTTVTASGTYSIDAMETNATASKALKVPRGATGSYFYLELRKSIGADAGLSYSTNIMNGVVFHWASPSDGSSSDLLDMTPETMSFSDPTLVVGKSWTDAASGVSFTVNSVGASSASVTVTLNGTPPPTCAHVAPSVSLQPAQTTGVKAGTAVAFTISVKNNDASPCTASTFGLTSGVPSGWTGTLSAASLSIAPSATSTATLTVTSAGSASNGSYNVSLAAKNAAATTAAATGTAVYVVNNPTNGGSGGTISDDFNRADASTPGASWTVGEGSLGIVSGELRNPKGVNSSLAVVTSLTGTTETAAADFASTDNGSTPQLGLVLRYKDARNYYYLYKNVSGGGGRKIRISRFVNGKETVLASVDSNNPAENTFFHLVAKANGSALTLEMDGAVVASATDTTFPTGLVGVRLTSSSAPSRVDNFTATVQ